jgi:acyl dehydratase
MQQSPTRSDHALGIGDRARRSRRVTAADIELFTAMTGDRNPVHYDADVARASRFGDIIVQGGVTSGLLNAVVAEQLPGPGSVFLETRWSYRAPVRPGDEITAEVEVIGVRSDKPITRLRTTITNQHGTVVLDGEAVVWRDPLVAGMVPIDPSDGRGQSRSEGQRHNQEQPHRQEQPHSQGTRS